MPDCTSCKTERKSVPYIVHESDMARLERSIKRLWILLILTIVLLVGTNAVWIVYESQFEDVVTTIEAEQITRGGGSNFAVAGDIIGTTDKTRTRKTGGNSGYRKCNMCGGTGRIKKK